MKSSDPRAIAARIIAVAKRNSKKESMRVVHRQKDRDCAGKISMQDRVDAQIKRERYRRRINAKMAATIRHKEIFRRPVASLIKKRRPKKISFSQPVQVGSFSWTQEFVEERSVWLRRESQKSALSRTLLKCRYVVSLPRSGRVWTRSIFRMMGYEERILFSHDGFDYDDMEGYKSNKRQYRETLVALLVRDPRDALVSMWNFCRFRARTEAFQGMSLWDYTKGHCGISRVISFLNDWADPGNLHRENSVYILRYEDMKKDIVSTFTRLLEFFSYEFGNIEWMRSVTPDVVEKVYDLKPSTDSRARHCRRAEVGAWRDYYEADQSAWLTERLRELNPVYNYG